WRLKNRDVGFREWAGRTGLTLGPHRGRTLWLILAVWVAVPVLVFLALAISAALGLLSLDLAHFSLYAKQLAKAGKAGTVLPVPAFVGIQIVFAIVVAPVINAIPALGEEW